MPKLSSFALSSFDLSPYLAQSLPREYLDLKKILEFHLETLTEVLRRIPDLHKSLMEDLPATVSGSWLQLPCEIQDIFTLQDMTRSPEERERAVERLAEKFDRQTMAKLRPEARKELRRAAGSHSRSMERELRFLVLARLFEAVEAVDELSLGDLEGIREAIVRALARLVAEDLLGPNWRQASQALPEFELYNPGPPPETIAEMRLTAKEVINSQGLTSRERQLIRLVCVEGYTAVEAAKRLGIKDSTARVLLHKARKKLRSA